MPGTASSSASSTYRQEPCNFVEIMPRLDEHLKRMKLRKAPKKTKAK